jgi:hypothetical protein
MAFTARTETYFDAASLSSPYDATVAKPTGTAQGDILFCHIGWRYPPAPTIDSVPTGWTLIAEYLDNNDRYALYYKVAGASEPDTYTWSFDGTCYVRVVCSCYTGGDFDAEDPIDVVSNTAYRASDNIVRAASMTVSTANSPLIFWACTYSASVQTFIKPTTPTDTWVEDDDAGSTISDHSTEICSMVWAGSGATGDMDAICSAITGTRHAFAVALNPAAAGWTHISHDKGVLASTMSHKKGVPVADISHIKGVEV